MSSDYPILSESLLITAVTTSTLFSLQGQNDQQSIWSADIFRALFGTLQRIYLHPLKSYSTPFFLSPESDAEGERLGC